MKEIQAVRLRFEKTVAQVPMQECVWMIKLKIQDLKSPGRRAWRDAIENLLEKHCAGSIVRLATAGQRRE